MCGHMVSSPGCKNCGSIDVMDNNKEANKEAQRRAFTVGLTTLLAGLPAWPAHAFFLLSPDWPSIKQAMRQRHPMVPQLSVQQLHDWLADTTRPAPLLLDVRAPAEHAVSHLQGARLAPDLAAARRALEGVAKDAAIVAYCSVGVRSTALAEKLIGEGWRNVSNLEGSIFEWANSGRPVFRGAARTNKVHPYNKSWGQLLDRRLWEESVL
jgi:rhodanese-related sulfurtransferase